MKKPSSPINDPWDVLKVIAAKLEGQILLAGLAFAIIFLMLIVSGRLPLQLWSTTLALFLALVVIVLGTHLFLQLRIAPQPAISQKRTPHIASTPRIEEDDQQRIIEALIEREILAIRERHFKRAVHKFDDKYWTNLDIHFLQLEQNDELVNQLASFIAAHYLEDDTSMYVVLDPVDFKAQPYTIGVVKKIAAKTGLRIVGIQEIKSNDKLVILAAIYSESLKRFLNDFSSSIHVAIMILAPMSQYLANELILPPNKVKTIVSLDSLTRIPEAKRKIMITGVVK